MKLYAAYGSNLDVNQMAVRCPDAIPVGSYMLPGYRITFRGNARGYGVANIERRTGSVVPLGLWKISESDEASLDIYEGYPRLYTKINIPVVLDNERTHAIVYVMTPGHHFATPSPYYFDVVLKGYHDFGFRSARNLYYAARNPIKDVNE